MTIEVRPLANFGAEIIGVDPRDISEDEKARLYGLWLEHGVLVFRGAENDGERQVRLAECFGPLQEHPAESVRVKGKPGLIFLGSEETSDNLPVHYVDGEVRRGFLYWHCDMIYVPDIGKGSLLRLVDVPPRGGNTEFADMAAAYDDLPEATKARIANLRAVYTARVTPERAWGIPGMEISVAPREQYGVTHVLPDLPPALQPLVFTHEETGRKQLLLSPASFVKIPGLPRDEGEALFEELTRHALNPKYRYVHEWSAGDMLLWDNRRTMHFATGYPPEYRRMAIRATLAETQPTGRVYEMEEQD